MYIYTQLYTYSINYAIQIKQLDHKIHPKEANTFSYYLESNWNSSGRTCLNNAWNATSDCLPKDTPAADRPIKDQVQSQPWGRLAALREFTWTLPAGAWNVICSRRKHTCTVQVSFNHVNFWFRNFLPAAASVTPPIFIYHIYSHKAFHVCHSTGQTQHTFWRKVISSPINLNAGHKESKSKSMQILCFWTYLGW